MAIAVSRSWRTARIHVPILVRCRYRKNPASAAIASAAAKRRYTSYSMPNSGTVCWIGGSSRFGTAPNVRRADLLHDHRQAEGRHDGERRGAADRLDHDALDQRAEEKADERCGEKGEPEVSGHLRRRPGDHGAHHEEVAVRDVDDVEQAEDDREAERDERDDEAPDQAVHRQKQQRFHRS